MIINKKRNFAMTS